MLRLGPADAPVVVVALPLLEEANRTRGVAMAVLRALAAHGIAGALPELPGQGESLLPTSAMTLAALRDAFRGAVAAIRATGRPVYVAAIRSGALLDAVTPADGRWHLAPQDGPALRRELARIGQRDGTAASVASVAGNVIAPAFLLELDAATVSDAAPARVVRLDGDPRPADRHVTGVPPWRRAEPTTDTVLAQTLAADISDWVRSCAAR